MVRFRYSLLWSRFSFRSLLPDSKTHTAASPVHPGDFQQACKLPCPFRRSPQFASRRKSVSCAVYSIHKMPGRNYMQNAPVSFHPPVLTDLICNVGIDPILFHSGLFCAGLPLFPSEKFRFRAMVGTGCVSVRAAITGPVFFPSGCSPRRTHRPNPFLTSFIRSSQYFALAVQIIVQASALAQLSQGFCPAEYLGLPGTIPFCRA